MTTYLIAWGIAFVVFAILEGITTQLVSIWFAIGSLAGFTAAVFDAPLIAQVMIFIIVSIVLIILTRPLSAKLLNKKMIPTNADSLIGKIGLVIETVDNFKEQGRIVIGGQDWAARSDDGTNLQKGTNVVINKIEGVKLVVHIAAPQDYE